MARRQPRATPWARGARQQQQQQHQQQQRRAAAAAAAAAGAAQGGWPRVLQSVYTSEGIVTSVGLPTICKQFAIIFSRITNRSSSSSSSSVETPQTLAPASAAA
ncbi:hypothetical protein ACSSS7_000846 [Eimeria intestinalis]